MEMRKVGGFSVVGIIITVTVLGVAGFARWQFYSKNNEARPSKQTSLLNSSLAKYEQIAE